MVLQVRTLGAGPGMGEWGCREIQRLQRHSEGRVHTLCDQGERVAGARKQTVAPFSKGEYSRGGGSRGRSGGCFGSAEVKESMRAPSRADKEGEVWPTCSSERRWKLLAAAYWGSTSTSLA